MFPILIAILVVAGASTAALQLIVKNLLYICQPSEVLIFAGPKQVLADGRRVGYRLVKGGKSLRVPLLERAFRMDLTNTIIELKVTNAYSKGGIPLSVEGVANIKVAGEDPTIHNAIERLLGKTREEIEKIARETLEGNLRGVLSSLTPQQVNEDKIAFAKSLLEEAEDDLERLGLVLDNLQIQSISDDVGYLDSIGRKQQAELIRDARIAEARAKAESATQSAENQKKTALKRIETQIAIARAEAERRVQDALTMRAAVVAEAESDIAAEVARTEAERAVQQARIKEVAQRLQADTVAPAEALCKRAIAEAKGNAAKIVEDGKAQAEGIEELARSWRAAGPNARDIFLFQKLEPLLKTLAETVPMVEVAQVTAIDSQGGNLAAQLATFVEQFRQASGVDLAAPLRQEGDRPSSLPPAPARSASATPRAAAATSGNRRPAPTVSVAALRDRVRPLLNELGQRNLPLTQVEATLKRTIAEDRALREGLKLVFEQRGRDALREIFAHPLLQVSLTAVEGWLMEG